ncbi:thiol-disulfide oxidoreductase DCC family protein [Pseudomarimonas arenosa]|uniref:Thiol-disulfide oxidoreductase DCC family protein n=1 Tax=Pseudomarimonas arenosa TaxID=2774145 RepID=A0AAW3ZLC9_9GAMM|nr:thiol-disulfide oxidoreductase DCC family protein [Pseudomarimonas arenosa]MBD8525987.1 thiol-disulfide oxidoreductase DCC family protein [Pseudomarimonas arenosa]
MSTEPGVQAIIVFDGVCHLCNAWVQFLLRFDRAEQFRFASMQSDSGRRLLTEHGLNPDDPNSFLLLSEGRARTDSDAILHVLHLLGGVWRLSAVFRLIPVALRDPLYRWIARNRYRLFGRRDTCLLPTPETAQRFLH